MKIKSFLAKPFAGFIYKQIKKGMETAVQDQQSIFNHLIKIGTKTDFGKDHDFTAIRSHADFVKQVPLRDYEEFNSYIEKIDDLDGFFGHVELDAENLLYEDENGFIPQINAKANFRLGNKYQIVNGEILQL